VHSYGPIGALINYHVDSNSALNVKSLLYLRQEICIIMNMKRILMIYVCVCICSA
jgi:hypothetical protein